MLKFPSVPVPFMPSPLGCPQVRGGRGGRLQGNHCGQEGPPPRRPPPRPSDGAAHLSRPGKPWTPSQEAHWSQAPAQPGTALPRGGGARTPSGTAEILKGRRWPEERHFSRDCGCESCQTLGQCKGSPCPHPVSIRRLFLGTLDWRCEARALGRHPDDPLTCQHLAGSGGWRMCRHSQSLDSLGV